MVLISRRVCMVGRSLKTRIDVYIRLCVDLRYKLDKIKERSRGLPVLEKLLSRTRSFCENKTTRRE